MDNFLLRCYATPYNDATTILLMQPQRCRVFNVWCLMSAGLIEYWTNKKQIGNFTKKYKNKKITGNYSRLACEIQFVRSMGYYLIQIYIPSGLIVIISWVSFWLNRNATPARVALGVTTVLTMTTLMSSTNAALPKISYVKSIDVYLGTCFVMVFASLLGKQNKNFY